MPFLASPHGGRFQKLGALKTPAEFRQVHGVGEAKLEAYGSTFLREIGEWAGTYRNSDKNLGCSRWDVPVRVAELLKNTQAIIEGQSTSPDAIAARFHHKLVSIHPFPNGNGRHSRFLGDLLTNRHGGDPFTWGGQLDLVSSSKTRNTYLVALRAADNGEIGPLLRFARTKSEGCHFNLPKMLGGFYQGIERTSRVQAGPPRRRPRELDRTGSWPHP